MWDFVHFLCCGILSCGILSCGILSVGILSCGILSCGILSRIRREHRSIFGGLNKISRFTSGTIIAKPTLIQQVLKSDFVDTCIGYTVKPLYSEQSRDPKKCSLYGGVHPRGVRYVHAHMCLKYNVHINY